MLYSICFIFLYGFLVLLRRGLHVVASWDYHRVQRVGFPSAENRFISEARPEQQLHLVLPVSSNNGWNKGWFTGNSIVQSQSNWTHGPP
jgi:hypothetical protein